MLSNAILMKFASSRQHKPNYQAPKTLEDALFDNKINHFLINNDVEISPNDELTSKCILGLIDTAVKYGVHMLGGQTIASAVGDVNTKYKIGIIRFNKWLKTYDLSEFYKLTVELIMFVKNHKLKINALTLADDVYMKHTQIDSEGDVCKPPLDRFAVREAMYHTQTHPFDEATPETVLNSRQRAGLTQKQAAAIVYVDERTWQRWESGERKMHKNIYELFLIKTGLL